MTNENVWDCQLILKYNNYTYLFNVQNHNKIKNKVLKEIDKTPSTKTQGVYKTDWKTDTSLKRTYWENYVKLLADNCIDILKNDLFKDAKQKTWHHNHWFHQYKNDVHNPENITNTDFSFPQGNWHDYLDKHII